MEEKQINELNKLDDVWKNYFEIQYFVQKYGTQTIKNSIDDREKEELIANFKKDFKDINPKDQLYINTLSLLNSIGVFIYEDIETKDNLLTGI